VNSSQAQRVSVPASSPAVLKGAFDHIVRDAYAAFATAQANAMPARREGDLHGDLRWALTQAEFSSKVQGENERASGDFQSAPSFM